MVSNWTSSAMAVVHVMIAFFSCMMFNFVKARRLRQRPTEFVIYVITKHVKGLQDD